MKGGGVLSDNYNNEHIPQRPVKKSRKKSKERTAAFYDKKTASETSANSKTAGRRGKKKSSGKKPSRAKRIIRILLLAILAAVLVAAVYAAVVIAKAPKIDPDNIYSFLNESSILYDDDGNQLYSIYSGDDGNRTNVEYTQIPENMINAIVSIEDKTFWKHHGFNFIRILGAIKDSIFSSEQISGTSTLTQQLARNIYLDNERTYARKIKEAYYTICLENKLSKEQIIEAYLNTINLGYGTYGIQSAANAYFSKDVEDLDLLECAALAALPQSPTTNALVLRVEKGSVNSDDKNILEQDNDWIYYYNGKASKERRDTVLEFMCEQGYITSEEKDKALSASLKKHMKLSNSSSSSFASYFTDYVIDEVVADLQENNGMSEQQARDYVYNGGLEIYTTLSSDAQEIVEKEYADTSNFPGTANLRTDGNGNILGTGGAILLYNYSSYFNSDGDFTLYPSEFKWRKDGSLLIKKNKRLAFYKTEVDGKTDYNIEFKNMYTRENGFFYSIEGGVISIDAKYKSLSKKGNMIISADFFKQKKASDFFIKSGSNLVIKSSNYTLRQKINQPQSAMVIIDNETAQIKAMIGGRGASGRLLYNRAISTRQPGSSIKPLAVYSSALQQGMEAAKSGKKQSFTYAYDNYGENASGTYGSYWSAASVINDAKMTVNGQVWPKNFYSGYKGFVTMREAVQQSINVCAVKVFVEVGPEYAAEQLKKFGITSVVETGDVNDMNAAALALGGMTKGISPVEMAGAYTALANLGTYTEPVAYTKVTDRNGDVILKSTQESHEVLDPGVAWIMDDILRTTVTNGIANAAAIGVQPVAGKTGTTDDKVDAWFCGFTPQYSASLWIGNDVNIQLTEGSTASARLWSKIMKQICAKLPAASFKSAPSNVIRYNGEYFISGTQSKISIPSLSKSVEICAETGELATPDCPDVKEKKFSVSAGTKDAEKALESKLPKYYCHLHNSNPNKYKTDPSYDNQEPDVPDEPAEEPEDPIEPENPNQPTEQ